MDTANRCRSLPNPKSKSKLARTFHKVITFNGGTAKIASTNGVGTCTLPNQQEEDAAFPGLCSKRRTSNGAESKDCWRRKLLLEALVAKLFAEVTTIKAAYAELQMAQQPYRSEVIQAADQMVVDSLKQLSEIKHRYIMDDIDHLSPQVTIMLAQVQEQQSLMKTYEITAGKLQADSEILSTSISSLQIGLQDAVLRNKGLESRLHSSGSCSLFGDIARERLGISHFVRFLPFVMKSVRNFVKHLVRAMEAASWDIDLGVRAIQPGWEFRNPSHRCFVFESFVNRVMLEGFENPRFGIQDGSALLTSDYCFTKLKKVTMFSSVEHFLATQRRDSSFCRFLRGKYLNLVHAKMENALFGNLRQRKLVSCKDQSLPGSPFFLAFAEMARRVWCANLLAFSFDEEVEVFRVKEGCRFSEAYMEEVAESGRNGGGGEDDPRDIRVGFTVVPGFKIGRNVVQSQVYLRR